MNTLLIAYKLVGSHNHDEHNQHVMKVITEISPQYFRISFTAFLVVTKLKGGAVHDKLANGVLKNDELIVMDVNFKQQKTHNMPELAQWLNKYK